MIGGSLALRLIPNIVKVNKGPFAHLVEGVISCVGAKYITLGHVIIAVSIYFDAPSE